MPRPCHLALLISLLALAGCSGLPSAGPSADGLVAGSSDALATYRMIDIDLQTVNLLEQRNSATSFAGFATRERSPDLRIGPGDRLSVHIWEASAGGLFSGPLSVDHFSTGARGTTIPDQIVGRDGAISVPYAGRIAVIGRSPLQVQAAIEKKLAGKAIEPQVLVTLVAGVSNLVTITGEVTSGARLPLVSGKERLLDMVAAAGGMRAPINETFVQLTRRGQTRRVAMNRIIAAPAQNVLMQPGDVLTLIHQPQSFTAFGATGRNAEITFDADGLSLTQALAKAGGLLDQRADATGVFVFRREPDESGAPSSVVYRLDLQQPGGLALAQRFPVLDKDLVYVSNAPMAEAMKSLQLLGSIISPAASSASLYAVAKP